MFASYSRMYFKLTQDPGYLLRIIQGNSSKFIGVLAQQIWITTQIHIVLEETYSPYHLNQKSEQSQLS